MYAAVPPTIAQVTDDSVDLSPMLMEGETLNLTCSAMGTPRPRVDWYRGDSRIGISSRTQITDTEIGATTLLSTLVISSVVVGDSGSYECRVENIANNATLQYQVVVSECVHLCIVQLLHFAYIYIFAAFLIPYSTMPLHAWLLYYN